MSNIQIGTFNFDGPAWNNVSENAKDFIQKLLQMDPTKRMSAVQALNHPWLKET